MQNFYSELVILVDACLAYNNEAFLAHFPQIYQVISQFLAVFSKNVEFFFTENLSTFKNKSQIFPEFSDNYFNTLKGK